MTQAQRHQSQRRSGKVERAISLLNGWLGDHLSRTGNGLGQQMAFYRDNRALTVEDLAAHPAGKVCIMVHGLSCNESSWRFASKHPGGDYGKLLEERCDYSPLYLRYNTGRRISENGRELAGLLDRFCTLHGAAVSELLLIGHSMGGLVIRSACHYGAEEGHTWITSVRHAVYLGSPHLGAPLEKATNLASNILGLFDTTATRVVREVLDTRSAGIKDLRFGNLVDEDWLDHDPDELLANRRVPIPWLASARHHRVAGQAIARATILGDVLVHETSAAGAGLRAQPGAPDSSDLEVLSGLDHMALARHPSVYEHIERCLQRNA